MPNWAETAQEGHYRAALAEAALRLLKQQGFAGTTISKIAAEVDVSPRTLLRYFTTKVDIVVSQLQSGTGFFATSHSAHPAS